MEVDEQERNSGRQKAESAARSRSNVSNENNSLLSDNNNRVDDEGSGATLSANSIRVLSVDDIHLRRGAVFVVERYLKPFYEAVLMLSRISDNLIFQPTEDTLKLIAYNPLGTAFGRVTLPKDFFEHFNVPAEWFKDDGGGGQEEQEERENQRRCKVEMKSMLHLFRAHHVAQIRIELDPAEDYAVFHINQGSDIDTCHVMNLQQCLLDDISRVLDDRHQLRNKIAIQAKQLNIHLAKIDSKEAKIIALPDSFKVQRHITLEDFKKARKTEVTIPTERFDLYHVHEPSTFIISLQYLRSILNFANHCGGMAIIVHFDKPGPPVIAVVEENVDYGVELILGTQDLGEEADGGVQEQASVPSSGAAIRDSNRKKANGGDISTRAEDTTVFGDQIEQFRREHLSSGHRVSSGSFRAPGSIIAEKERTQNGRERASDQRMSERSQRQKEVLRERQTATAEKTREKSLPHKTPTPALIMIAEAREEEEQPMDLDMAPQEQRNNESSRVEEEENGEQREHSSGFTMSRTMGEVEPEQNFPPPPSPNGSVQILDTPPPLRSTGTGTTGTGNRTTSTVLRARNELQHWQHEINHFTGTTATSRAALDSSRSTPSRGRDQEKLLAKQQIAGEGDNRQQLSQQRLQRFVEERNSQEEARRKRQQQQHRDRFEEEEEDEGAEERVYCSQSGVQHVRSAQQSQLFSQQRQQQSQRERREERSQSSFPQRSMDPLERFLAQSHHGSVEEANQTTHEQPQSNEEEGEGEDSRERENPEEGEGENQLTEEELERFQRRWLSLSEESLDEEQWLARKRVLCYASDEE